MSVRACAAWKCVFGVCFLVLFAARSLAGAADLERVRPQSLPTASAASLAAALAPFKHRPVLINFWASWCEPCREEMPALHRLAQRYRSQGLGVLTVAVADNDKRAADLIWETAGELPELPVVHDRDQAVSRAWEARMLPTTVVLDRRHRIVLRARGVVDWDAKIIDRHVRALLK